MNHSYMKYAYARHLNHSYMKYIFARHLNMNITCVKYYFIPLKGAFTYEYRY